MGKFNLANALLQYRTRECLSQKQMGELLNMSRSAYDRLEKGVRIPGYDEVVRLVRILELRIDEDEIIPSTRNPLPESIVNLKHDLLYNTIGLYDALRRVKAFAKRINCRNLLKWSHSELVGYLENPGFSDYRIYPHVYLVNFESGNEKFIEFPVPFELLDPQDEKGRLIFLCEPVFGFYENFLLNDGLGSDPAKHMSPLVRNFLKEIFDPDVRIIGVSRKTTGRTIRKVILSVQEIILNFILNLEQRFGPSPSLEGLRLYSEEIDLIFLEALARTGKAAHLDLQIKFVPYDRENNSDILMDFLYEHVSDEHFDEIWDLLEEEEKKGKIPESFGYRITNMIKRMAEIYPKLGPEGSRLKDAIRGYLGFDKGG